MTEQQVEAAAIAMIQCTFASHECPVSDEIWHKYLDMARRALAAAETTVIDESDIQLAKADPSNSLEARSLRILDDEIARLKRTMQSLQFVRETLESARH